MRNTRQIKRISLVALWCIGVIGVLLWSSMARIRAFDPQLILFNEATTINFDSSVVERLKHYVTIDGPTVVHIIKASGCVCDQFATPHATALTDALDNKDYQLVTLEVEPDSMPSFITATPAVAVVDEKEQLRYFGPYAAGLGCITNQTFVERIEGITRAPQFLGAVINQDVQGCFCDVKG